MPVVEDANANVDDGTNGTDGTGGVYSDTDSPGPQAYDFTTSDGLSNFLQDLDNTGNLQRAMDVPRAIGRLKVFIDADNYYNHLRPLGTEIKDIFRAAHKKYLVGK